MGRVKGGASPSRGVVASNSTRDEDEVEVPSRLAVDCDFFAPERSYRLRPVVDDEDGREDFLVEGAGEFGRMLLLLLLLFLLRLVVPDDDPAGGRLLLVLSLENANRERVKAT